MRQSYLLPFGAYPGRGPSVLCIVRRPGWPCCHRDLLSPCHRYLSHRHTTWLPAHSCTQHRYYGKSVPVNGSDAAAMRYLTVEQALTDYIQLIQVSR